MEALDKHKTLKGVFNRNNPNLIHKAADQAAHRGYQTWHRQYDDIVVQWLDRNPLATPGEFTNFLNGLHKQPWLNSRIPNVSL